MIRPQAKFAFVLLLSLAVPAWAGTSASVSGVVRDGSHAPMMGAVVELFGSAPFPLLAAFTDFRGHYQFTNLAPGHYSIRVLQPDSTSVHRKKIQVTGNTHAIVDLTLASVFDVSEWFPAVPRSGAEPADDWKWTLRSGVDRPVLRWMDERTNPNRKQDDNRSSHTVSGRAELTSGSSQFGEGGFRQEAFVRLHDSGLEETVLHMRTSSAGDAFFAGGMERNPGPGDTARAVAAYRTLPIDNGEGVGRLQILQVRGGEQLKLSDQLLMQFGAETEAVRAGKNVTAALPFLAVHFRDAGNEISYRLATSTGLQGLMDLAASGGVPALAMRGGDIRLTHALHQEISVERNFAGMQLEAAYFYDHLIDPVLNGYGDGNAAEFSAGDVLLDPVTGAFRTAGPNYSGGGFRVFAARQMHGNIWTAVEYAEGPAIVLPAASLLGGGTFTEALSGVATTRTQSVLFSMHGRLPGSDTRWNAGYRWQPEEGITAVDPFDTGMSAPFLSLTLHQPLSSANASPDRLELELVMQNMLAQGYRPVYVVDGQTLYFAQAPRLVTGGLAFSF